MLGSRVQLTLSITVYALLIPTSVSLVDLVLNLGQQVMSVLETFLKVAR